MGPRVSKPSSVFLFNILQQEQALGDDCPAFVLCWRGESHTLTEAIVYQSSATSLVPSSLGMVTLSARASATAFAQPWSE